MQRVWHYTAVLTMHPERDAFHQYALHHIMANAAAAVADCGPANTAILARTAARKIWQYGIVCWKLLWPHSIVDACVQRLNTIMVTLSCDCAWIRTGSSRICWQPFAAGKHS
jgi:hypothetical protein